MAISLRAHVQRMINVLIKAYGLRGACRKTGFGTNTLYRWGGSHGMGVPSYGSCRFTMPDPKRLRKLEEAYFRACLELEIEP